MIWFHIFWTATLLGVFLAIVFWAWNSRQKSRFSDAARIPLDDNIPLGERRDRP